MYNLIQDFSVFKPIMNDLLALRTSALKSCKKLKVTIDPDWKILGCRLLIVAHFDGIPGGLKTNEFEEISLNGLFEGGAYDK